ncbi:hypothetical protein [Streptomyces viridosporus]|uniref:hypothetical protein n=1 Tax=Streptomyces viridosporus TaxID=67581 RepID=UPI001CC638C1|nr:hypothetical protein [Streptomyces viridosporus]
MNEWEWDRLGATSSPGGAVVLLTADTCRADGLDALIATEVPVLPAASAKKEAASWTKLP